MHINPSLSNDTPNREPKMKSSESAQKIQCYKLHSEGKLSDLGVHDYRAISPSRPQSREEGINNVFEGH